MTKKQNKQQRLLEFLKTIEELKAKDKKNNRIDYSELSDIKYDTTNSYENKEIAVKRRENIEYLNLLKRVKGVVSKYNEMKDFIIKNFVLFSLSGMSYTKGTSIDKEVYKKVSDRIADEMKSNIKNIGNMVTKMTQSHISELNKSLIFNDLISLVSDLEYRFKQYKPYYESHEIDLNYGYTQ